MQRLPESSVDMIFADPPYHLSNDGITCHAGTMVSVNKGAWDKSRGMEENFVFHFQWLQECHRLLKNNGSLWVSGTYHNIYACGHALQIIGYHILNDISWLKPNASPNLSCRFFTASHETLIWARKNKKGSHTFNYKKMRESQFPEDKLKAVGKQMRSVWSIPATPPSEKRLGKHPTQKPLALMDRVIRSSSSVGDTILDPFCGSGSTGVSAVRHKRSFWGIESDENYVDLTARRIQDESNVHIVREEGKVNAVSEAISR